MKVAYLTNQYPKVSHSFIRREIIALEELGVQIKRFSVRGWDIDLVDPLDIQERSKTTYLLKEGVLPLFFVAIKLLCKKPLPFFKTLFTAFKLGLRADKSPLYHLVYFLEACKLANSLEAEKIEHLHVHFGTNPTELALLAKMLSSISYSFTVHGPEELDKPEFIKLADKVKHSAFVVAISSYCRSQIFRWIPYADWSKVKEVHCGLDQDFFDAPSNAITTANRLICVGRICEQKGQLLLIDAAYILSNMGVDFHLVLGGDGEMRDEVEQKIKAYGLESKITITGWISSEQVKHEIMKSKAMVLPSFAEGLPVVIMEAMALKKPVLSTYIAAIPELVRDQEHGFLFPAGNVDAIVEAMEKVLTLSPEVLNEMGNSAFLSVKQEHSIEKEALKLKALFEAL